MYIPFFCFFWQRQIMFYIFIFFFFVFTTLSEDYHRFPPLIYEPYIGNTNIMYIYICCTQIYMCVKVTDSVLPIRNRVTSLHSTGVAFGTTEKSWLGIDVVDFPPYSCIPGQQETNKALAARWILLLNRPDTTWSLYTNGVGGGWQRIKPGNVACTVISLTTLRRCSSKNTLYPINFIRRLHAVKIRDQKM